ncbi:SCAN domain-containing protein 3-like [Acyrthosiphon pisum]|uniref:HAT C-terminal dimerisation domain-containing protein n=1 Tax=Acyrthosiphon pisum TaxID=7029 RepID=A0A8R2B9A8_ACYPI|nr:SCAN domain-containing protein 3-like [Acyrthosiphon pisum]|eukprot:XP_008187344.1 PREDICTED: SCAN domain-containing protein 3-like [Acyrthosiphon pisum]
MPFPFSETNSIENISTQISNLFDMDSTKFESEIIKIKSDIFLKARGSETNFWNLLSEEKYPGLRNVALQLLSYFGSTYLCETAFSHMKMIKTEFRSTLSDDHLEQCLRLAVSNYSLITTNWSTTCNVTLQQWPDQQNNMLIKLI